jgi:hypothetical protein
MVRCASAQLDFKLQPVDERAMNEALARRVAERGAV